MKFAIAAALLLACLTASGCATPHHHHRPVRTVTLLDAEHGHRDILVVNVRPAYDRACWRHYRHWHCRRR